MREGEADRQKTRETRWEGGGGGREEEKEREGGRERGKCFNDARHRM